MHKCVSKLTIIGSNNGLSPGRRQALIWTNAGILLIGPVGTNFSEILIEIYTFSFKKMHLKILSAKWRPFCLGLNVFTIFCQYLHFITISSFQIVLIWSQQKCSWHSICAVLWLDDQKLYFRWSFFLHIWLLSETSSVQCNPGLRFFLLWFYVAAINVLAVTPSWGCRDHSGYGLSQWEEALQCKASSHWPSPWPEWSLGCGDMNLVGHVTR